MQKTDCEYEWVKLTDCKARLNGFVSSLGQKAKCKFVVKHEEMKYENVTVAVGEGVVLHKSLPAFRKNVSFFFFFRIFVFQKRALCFL